MSNYIDLETETSYKLRENTYYNFSFIRKKKKREKKEIIISSSIKRILYFLMYQADKMTDRMIQSVQQTNLETNKEFRLHAIKEVSTVISYYFGMQSKSTL